jgi:hypothetical protein
VRERLDADDRKPLRERGHEKQISGGQLPRGLVGLHPTGELDPVRQAQRGDPLPNLRHHRPISYERALPRQIPHLFEPIHQEEEVLLRLESADEDDSRRAAARRRCPGLCERHPVRDYLDRDRIVPHGEATGVLADGGDRCRAAPDGSGEGIHPAEPAAGLLRHAAGNVPEVGGDHVGNPRET